jgi:hypothetical protein
MSEPVYGPSADLPDCFTESGEIAPDAWAKLSNKRACLVCADCRDGQFSCASWDCPSVKVPVRYAVINCKLPPAMWSKWLRMAAYCYAQGPRPGQFWCPDEP